MTGMDIQLATHGRWLGGVPDLICGLATDSRTLREGDLFVALRGPRFDGHRFADDAAMKGAIALVGDTGGITAWRHTRIPVLEVSDTLHALGDIAAAWREHLACRLIAITGSFGKTTLRSMLEHGLTKMGLRVSATRQNENNLIGVPLTLLRAEGNEDVVLVECGISERGEMERLAEIVRPDISVITGLSMAHSEGLGNLAEIAHEKARLLERTSGWCALGEGVSSLLEKHARLPALPCLDMDNREDEVVRWTLEDRKLRLVREGQRAEISLALPAPHLAADMALALSIILHLYPRTDFHLLARKMQDWRPVSGRMQCLPGPNGSTIINDAYNANPASMAASLKTLRSLEGGKFAILGDMEELGDKADQLHASLDISGLDGLILVGPRMRALHALHPESMWVADARAAADLARRWPLSANDHILIKASRAMRLDETVNCLMEPDRAV